MLRAKAQNPSDFAHFLQRLSVDHGVAPGNWQHPGEHVDHGALPGAIVPEQAEDLAAVEIQTHLLDLRDFFKSFSMLLRDFQ